VHKVHRIYTEDVDRKAVIAATAAAFSSFTLQPTTGYFQGKAEASIVIEIVEAEDRAVEDLARKIRAIAGQKTVLIMSLAGEARQVR
jgi:hypothetical protein